MKHELMLVATVINKTFLRLSFIAFFLIIFSISYAANTNKKDSLLKMIEQHWENNQMDSLVFQSHQLIDLCGKENSNKSYALANYYLGRYFLNIGLADSSIYYLEKSLNYFINNDTLKSGISHFLIGANFTYLNKIDSSIFYYLESNKYLEMTTDSVWNSVLNNYLSITYFEIGDYPLSLHYSLKSLEYLKTSKDSLSIGNIYNTIGNIYRKMGDIKKEKLAYHQAINILKSIPLNLALAMAYNNLSEIYINEDSVYTGFEFLEKAKKIYLVINYPLGLCSYYSVKSNYYFYKNPPQFDSVISLSKKSSKIAYEYNDFRQFADASNYLGRAYLKRKEYLKAEEILLKAYEKAQEYQFKNEKSNIALSLSQLYEELRRYQKANKYLKIHQQIRDSLFNEVKVKEFADLDLKYQLKEKQLNDSLEKVKLRLTFDNKINQLKLEKKNDLYLKWIFIGVIIILISGIINLVLNMNRKQLLKEKELLNAQEKIKLKNQEISFHLLSQTRYNHQLEELKEKLSVYTNKFRAKKDREQFENILYHLSKHKTNPLDEFEDIFKSIYPGFFKTLSQLYPELTSRELQICALIRLNFSTKDISSITNLAVNTLETSRYRIRKKLKLQSNNQLYLFLLKF